MKKQHIRCPYCGGTAVLRDASYVHGSKAKDGKVYVCCHYPACNSYVSVVKGTTIPQGTLANPDLRRKRITAHRIFDQIWKQGILDRQEAYRWIADKFCLNSQQAHIGEFSDYMCEQLIKESLKVLKSNHVPLQAA